MLRDLIEATPLIAVRGGIQTHSTDSRVRASRITLYRLIFWSPLYENWNKECHYVWPQLGMCMPSNSNFSLLCTCPWMTWKPRVWIWELQINFQWVGEFANRQSVNNENQLHKIKPYAKTLFLFLSCMPFLTPPPTMFLSICPG